MKNVSTHKQPAQKPTISGKQYSYAELIDYLNTHWVEGVQTDLSCIKQLDTAFGSIASKIPSIFISGTNGKSLTTHFTTRLLKQEGLCVGTFFSPHILTYNERLVCNNELITNKLFTELGSELLNTATALNLTPSSMDMLTMMALLQFNRAQVDVALWELPDMQMSPIMICSQQITAITRVTDYEQTEKGRTLAEKKIVDFIRMAPQGSHIIAADQNKHHLTLMQQTTLKHDAQWAMPIRKLAPLPYPFEQLHGRCAALAERIASTYINEVMADNSIIVSNSLLTKQKGQRGRPTLEAKRQAELNPRRTIEQFWKETCSTLAGRFQLLDKEKPSILLDTACNLDALENLLLGIRLLHYKRPLKGLTLILGCPSKQIDLTEFLKLLRYFFKKNSGQVIVCPAESMPGAMSVESWDAEKITNDIKSMKIKTRMAHTFKEAYTIAHQSVDERHGLVVITGSSQMVSAYWRFKGMKKL